MVERALDFDNGDVRLSGTLTLPDSPPPKCPAVLLIQGSGPTDRDGNQPPDIMANVLAGVASVLASSGIASLRYDKRGLHKSSVAPHEPKALLDYMRFDNFVSDARAGFTALSHQPEIDPIHCGVFGHSEGGLIALHLATPPAACVMLAATAARRVDVLLAAQLDGLARRQGATDAQRAQLSGELRSIFDTIRRTDAVPETISPGLRALFPPYIAGFYHQLADIDPARLAARASVPMAIIQGAADMQVSPTDDAAVLQRAAPMTDMIALEALDHNFRAASVKEPGPSAAALSQVAGWFSQHL